MKRRTFLELHLQAMLAVVLTVATAGIGHAQEFRGQGMTIVQPWARPTIAGRPLTAVYCQLVNADAQPDRLVSVRTALTPRAELHQTTREGDVMQMRPVEAIAVPAKQTVKLEPGGYHIMLLNLERQLKEGERFQLILKFERAGEVTVDVMVENRRGEGQHKH